MLSHISTQLNKVYNSVLASYTARKEKDRMRETSKRAISFFPILLVIMLSSVQTAYPSGLVLTITQGGPYNLGENIVVNGTLTSNSLPVPDGLVTVQVNTPRGDDPNNLFFMRTLTTGSEPSGPWSVEILEAYACDLDGNPMSSFRRGGAAGFQVTVRNNDASSQFVMAILSLCDSSRIPFATLLMINKTVEQYQTISARRWIEEMIPANAATGVARLYAVALINWPQSGGVAWCPEKSSNFTITLGSGGGVATGESQETPSLSTTPGNFNVSFRTSDNGGILGNYTIHATSWYNMSYVSSQETFQAILVADVNGDKVVDMADISMIIDAFMTTPGSPNWNPSADINKDNSVDMSDISMAIEQFLKWGQ